MQFDFFVIFDWFEFKHLGDRHVIADRLTNNRVVGDTLIAALLPGFSLALSQMLPQPHPSPIYIDYAISTSD